MSYSSRDESKLVGSERHQLSFKGISLRTPWQVKRLALTSFVMTPIFLVILMSASSFSAPVVLFAILCGGSYLTWTVCIYSFMQKLDTRKEAREVEGERYLKATEIFAVFGMVSLLLWSCIFLWLGVSWAFALDVRAYLPILGVYSLAFAVSFLLRQHVLDLEVKGTPNTWWGKLWAFGSIGLYAFAAAVGAGWGMMLTRTLGYEKASLLIGLACIVLAFLFIPGVALNWARWRVLRTRSSEPYDQ